VLGDADHTYCIVDEVAKLMKRGYHCYLEYEIPLGNRKKIVVDIYAVKGDKQVLIEVGTLSYCHSDRFEIIRKLYPKAKIVWVHQWKNYGLGDGAIFWRHICKKAREKAREWEEAYLRTYGSYYVECLKPELRREIMEKLAQKSRR